MTSSSNFVIRDFQTSDTRDVINILVESFSGKFDAMSSLTPEETANFLFESGFVQNQPFQGYLVAEYKKPGSRGSASEMEITGKAEGSEAAFLPLMQEIRLPQRSQASVRPVSAVGFCGQARLLH